MTDAPTLTCVGAIAGAFGVRGEVRVKSFTEDPAALFELGPLCDEAGAVVLTVTRWRPLKDDFAVVAQEVATREEAMAMRSTRLYVRREALPEADEDEFYHVDLIGLAVVSPDGAPLGEVRAVHDFGAGDLLEVWKTPGVRDAWMVPFTKAAVPRVDVKAGVVVVNPPAEEGGDEASGV